LRSDGALLADYFQHATVRNADGSERKMDLLGDVLAPYTLEFGEGLLLNYASSQVGSYLGKGIQRLFAGSAGRAFLEENAQAMTRLSHNLALLEERAAADASAAAFLKTCFKEYVGASKFIAAAQMAEIGEKRLLKEMGIAVSESNALVSFLA